MSGFNTFPVSTRVFVTWPPGADTPHDTRLKVSQHVSEQLEPDGAGHQFDYNDMVVGIARNDPVRHMRLKGLMDNARKMAGCDVHIWIGLSIVPNMYEGDLTIAPCIESPSDLEEIDITKYMVKDDDAAL